MKCTLQLAARRLLVLRQMYRHVSTFHLDHTSGVVVHRVEGHATGLYGPRPWGTRCAFRHHICGFGPFFLPWTVRHQIWADALKPCHSGVSTDVLLFSNLSLVHHYRVFQKGLPHFAFRKDYLTRLRVFVSQLSAMAQCALPSPVRASSARNVRPCDAETRSPRKTRRLHGQKSKTRVWDIPVCVPASMTVVQDVHEMEGKIVYDLFCRSRFNCDTSDFRRWLARLHRPVWLLPRRGRFHCPDVRLRSGQPTRGLLRYRRMIPGQIWMTN